ncbi:MAG: hypothetical protein KTR31_17115 [Myxococcales bacterium]|nr:hypothetical protein [Myxococcales bacterium]
MLTCTLLSFLLLGSPALAQDGADAPEFLLADLGVRIDLPAGPWSMSRWSDWDFEAEHVSSSGKMLLYVWATPVQVPIDGDGQGWGQGYLDKLDELAGAEPSLDATQVAAASGRPAAMVDASFRFGEGGPEGVLRGATVEIKHQNLHVAVIGSARARAQVERQRRAIAEGLDFHEEPAKPFFGATLEAKGISTQLPKEWRPPFDAEMSEVNAVAGRIGVSDLEPCWTALRPRAGTSPDVMVTCQGGLLLGVVDEHSFEAADALLRDRMFGDVDVAVAEQVDLDDRVGFLYSPREGLAVGVVPYDKGVARTWVLGAEANAEAAKAVLQQSSYSGPHPASVGERVTYWLVHRTTSLPVLATLAGLLVLLGLVGLGVSRAMGSGRSKYADFDD